jgi:3-hydroxyethyl bacteriochlorophyllide a dehydrogenase
MTTTRALVISAPHTLALRDVALVAAGPGDVTVTTRHTSISAGTERMLLAGRMPHPMLQFPVVPGYETVGVITAVGADVPAARLGEWVYVGGARCFHDVNAAWGGQSARLVVDAARAVPLGALTPSLGVLLALAATALHGVDLAAPTRGSRVLVLGQGPVGQIAARLAAGRGAWVTVADRNPARLALSRADARIDTTQRGYDAADGRFDTIIEATGSMAALTAALPQLGDGGTIMLLGYYDELQLPYMPLFLRQARLLTAREWAPGDLQRCLAALQDGTLDLAPLITHRRPIAEHAAAYATALDDPACLKLILDWE